MPREQITMEMLRRLALQINKATNSPTEMWPGTGIGMSDNHYYVDYGSGGARLERVDGRGGHNVLSCGYLPKRELFNRIQAFLEGVRSVGPPF